MTLLDGNGFQPACHAHPEAKALYNAEWLGESGPTSGSFGSIWVSGNVIVGLPCRLHGSYLFLCSRRSNAQRVSPYLWRRLGLSVFVLSIPFFVSMNGKLNLFSWEHPWQMWRGEGEGGKLCGKQSQCKEIKVFFNFDAEQLLPSSPVFRLFCVMMQHIRRPEIAIFGLIRR